MRHTRRSRSLPTFGRYLRREPEPSMSADEIDALMSSAFEAAPDVRPLMLDLLFAQRKAVPVVVIA